MKNKHLAFGLIIIAITGLVGVFSVMHQNDDKSGISPMNYKYKKGFSNALKWNTERQVNPETGIIEQKDVMKAMEQVNKNNTAKALLNLNWTELGPDNVGGRTRAILVDKNNPNTVFAGGVAGGLWKSTNAGQSWVKVKYTGNSTDIEAGSSMAISCIHQTADGTIYFGTGESYAQAGGINYNSGAKGQGIWKSTDGTNFTRLASTWTSADAATKSAFCMVNKIASAPGNSNRLYVGTYKGLRVSDDAGATWRQPIPNDNTCEDVEVGTGGTVIVSIGHRPYISPTGNDGTWVYTFDETPTGVHYGRLEFAISPQDDNYIYCLAANVNGYTFDNVYRSTNKGVSWQIIGPGGSDEFDILGTQGYYGSTIAVFPNNKNKIICGGQFYIWVWEEGQTWRLASQWVMEQSYDYVHADHHTIVFHPTNPSILYIGSDGGVTRSNDGGMSFITLNRKYNVTQFYGIGFGNDGRVIGGTQDNGTQYINFTGNSSMNAKEIKGGDGGYCEISNLNSDITYATTYFGDLGRSETPGSMIDGNFFNDAFMTKYYNIAGQAPGVNNGACSFVTPIALWESFNDQNSIDFVSFTADKNYVATPSAPVTVYAKSKVKGRTIPVVLTSTLAKDSSVHNIKDPYQSMLAIGMKDNVWITRTSNNFTIHPAEWYPAMPASTNASMINTMAFSKDGNYLYAASNNTVYRISNLATSRTAAQMDATKTTCTIQTKKIGQFSGIITSIAVDPANPNNVIVTVGGYGNIAGNVFYSYNAATTTSSNLSDNFINKQGNLPNMPVYSSIIHVENGLKVVLGTEFGIWTTDNINATTVTWTDQSPSEMGNVPVYMLKQQIHEPQYVSNYGTIYAGTHGRGIWKCELYKWPNEIKNTENVSYSNFVYPNPARNTTNVKVELSNWSDVSILIYDIRGKLVKQLQLTNQGIGEHNYPVSISELKSGQYIVNIVTNNSKVSSKLLVY